MKQLCFWLLTISLFSIQTAGSVTPSKGIIKGVVTDASTHEPIIGASVVIEGTAKGAAANLKGEFALTDITPGEYTISVRMLSYNSFVSEPISVKEGEILELSVSLSEEVNEVGNVIVVGRRAVGTETGILSQVRTAKVVASGVSAQQIARSQDRDASEVVKRIPGISVLDDKYIVVRGLPQRYNNTWINGATVPSTESDSRAFSFDLIPSSQIESIMVIKTLAAEYPADYTGGFVMIETRRVPEKNQVQVSYGTSFNSSTHFKDFLYLEGSRTDWLGFDNGTRALRNFVPSYVDIGDEELVNKVTREGFNNNWTLKTRKPLPDQKVNLSIDRVFSNRKEDRFGLSFAGNYNSSQRSIFDMMNNQYGVYDYTNDVPTYRYQYTDDQYTTEVKIGGMLGLSYVPKAKENRTISKYEFRNIFNQIGRDRYTYRYGRNWHESCEQISEDYYYESRTMYSGLLSGNHLLRSGKNEFTWKAGYNHSGTDQPDRRKVERRDDGGTEGYRIHIGSVDRYFTKMKENSFSGSLDYVRKVDFRGSDNLEIKTGVFAERKWRDFDSRFFSYNNGADFPVGNLYLPNEELFAEENFGMDKLYANDQTSRLNNYDANTTTVAAYAAVNLPLGKFSVYAGLRYEYYLMKLCYYTSATKKETRNHDDPQPFYPSVNVAYKINKNSLLRAAYGKSVNRPEYREVSSMYYYDFDIFSLVAGNPDLKQATIHNLDLRYEYYPSPGETVSLALFYKSFSNPIEWTYMVTGGEFQYCFINGNKANNFGVELELRKNLGFMGLENFTANLNVAYVDSKVKFDEDSKEGNRPMQGQSPYLINAALYYQTGKGNFSAALMYNRIGKRIVGLGRRASGSGDFNSNIPNLYELARNSLDLTFAVKLNRALELRGGVKDILNEKVRFEQFPEFKDSDERIHQRTQAAKTYNTGRTYNVTLSATF